MDTQPIIQEETKRQNKTREHKTRSLQWETHTVNQQKRNPTQHSKGYHVPGSKEYAKTQLSKG